MTIHAPTIRMPERMVNRQVLPNGITFLYAPNPYNEIVAVHILSRRSSSNETGEKAGMVNLCMRLLSAGTERHTEEQIAEKLEHNGAHFRAEAGKDWSIVNLLTTTHFLKEDLETVLELLECPTYPEEKLVREREITKMNIREQEDSRLTFTMRIFRRHFFGSHPYAWPSIGLLETIDNIHRDDLVTFADSAFDSSQLLVSVVGGPENGEVENIINDFFSPLSSRKNISFPQPPAATPAITCDSEVIERRESESSYLVLGYPGPGITERDAVPIRLLSALLGASMDSRLFREIRDKRGLCYQVGSHYTANLGLSPLIIYIVTTPSHQEEAISCAEAEIARLKEEPVSEEELNRYKTFINGNYVMSMETNLGQASRYASYEIAGLGWDYANRFPDEINRVTPETITAVARRRLTHRLLTITAPPDTD